MRQVLPVLMLLVSFLTGRATFAAPSPYFLLLHRSEPNDLSLFDSKSNASRIVIPNDVLWPSLSSGGEYFVDKGTIYSTKTTEPVATIPDPGGVAIYQNGISANGKRVAVSWLNESPTETATFSLGAAEVSTSGVPQASPQFAVELSAEATQTLLSANGRHMAVCQRQFLNPDPDTHVITGLGKVTLLRASSDAGSPIGSFTQTEVDVFNGLDSTLVQNGHQEVWGVAADTGAVLFNATLWFRNGDVKTYTFVIENGQPRHIRERTMVGDYRRLLAISRDGKRVVLHLNGPSGLQTQIVDISSGGEATVSTLETSGGADISADGRWAVFAKPFAGPLGYNEVVVAEIDTGLQRTLAHIRSGQVYPSCLTTRPHDPPPTPQPGPFAVGPITSPDSTLVAADNEESGTCPTTLGPTGQEEGAIPFEDPNTPSSTQTPGTQGACGGVPGAAPNKGRVNGDVDPKSGKIGFGESEISWDVNGNPFRFERTFNGSSTVKGDLGIGWSHSFERRIEDNGANGAIEIDGRGAGRSFTAQEGGTYASADGSGVSLARLPDGTWSTRYPSGMSYTYRANGKLDHFSDSNQNTTTLGYASSGELTHVTDPAGGALTFERTEGLITTARAKDGQEFHFGYDDQRGDRLVSVADDSFSRISTYSYDDQERLTLRGGNGEAAIIYGYDSEGRVNFLLEGGDNQSLFSFIEYPSDSERILSDSTGRTSRYILDDTGRQVQRIDPAGRVFSCQWDSAGRLVAATDPEGRTTQWEYSAGRLVSITHPEQTPTTINRDPLVPNTVGITLPNGTTIAREHDDRGNLVLVRNELGQETRVLRAPNGLPLSVIDAQARTQASFGYDSSGNAISITDGVGGVTHIVRDGLGRPSSITSPGGRTESSEYFKALRLVTAVVDPEGHRYETDFDTDGRPVKIRTPRPSETKYTWDRIRGRDRLIKVEDDNGGVSAAVYDDNARQTSVTDQLGRTTTYDRDVLGQVIAIHHPDESVDQIRYTTSGLVFETENARGAVTRFDYDPRDNLTGITFPDGSRRTIGRDLNDRVTSLTNSDLGVTQFVRDAAGQVTSIIDALGYSTIYTHSPTGALTKIRNARGKETTLTLDPMDRATAVTDALGRTSSQILGADGEVTTSTNAAGRASHTEHDQSGRIHKLIDPLGHFVKFDYSPAGDLKTLTDANNHAWQFDYDVLGRLITQTDPAGLTKRKSYNAASELTELTLEDGAKIKFTRDLRGRVTAKEYVTASGGTEAVETFGHDVVGNLTRVENDAVLITSDYDLMDRETVRRVLFKATNQTRTTQFAYDSMGRRRLATDDRGRMVAYAHDQKSQLLSMLVVEPASLSLPQALRARTFSYQWDPVSNLVEADLPNKTRTRRTYDDADQLVEIVHEKLRPDQAPNVLGRFSYTRDAAGNITSITDKLGRITAYGYSARDELVSASLPAKQSNRLRGLYDDVLSGPSSTITGTATVTYTYDPAGNRIDESMDGRSILSVFGPNNELLSRGAEHFTYDARGNRRERTLKDGKKHIWEWDVAGRARTFLVENGNGPKARERFAYDPSNRRVLAEDVPSNTRTHSLWDEWSVGEEWSTTGTGSVSSNSMAFLRDPLGDVTESFPLPPADNPDQDYVTDDPALENLTDGQVAKALARWHFSDHIGSTAYLSNNKGKLVNRMTYGPWGEPLTGDFKATSFGFTGYQHGVRARPQYAVNRWYDPLAGRFLSRDPLEFVDGPNLYAYVSNNPINLVDPYGLSLKGPGQSDAAKSVKNWRDIVRLTARVKDHVKEQAENIVKGVTGRQDPGTTFRRAVGCSAQLSTIVALDELTGLPEDQKQRVSRYTGNLVGLSVPEYPWTDSMRRHEWREIHNDPPGNITPDMQREIKERGWRGPTRINQYGERETMELSHEPKPRREGGTEVVPRWPDEHAEVDKHRRMKRRPTEPKE